MLYIMKRIYVVVSRPYYYWLDLLLVVVVLVLLLVGQSAEGAAVPPARAPLLASSASTSSSRHSENDNQYEQCTVDDGASSSSSSPSSSSSSTFWDVILRGGGGRRAQSAATLAPSQQAAAPWLDGLKSGLASAMAAACVKTLLQPIDAIKTTQQYYHSTSRGALSVAGACREIFRLGGLGKFYAGLGVTVIGAMPGVSLYFGVYQYCKKRLRADTAWGASHPRAAVALSAAVGNTVASFSRVPYECLKQKLQLGVYATTWEALVAATKSPMALLFPKGGVAIQMIRDVPYAVATLVVYETLQGAFAGSAKERDFVLGGLAGGFGSWVTVSSSSERRLMLSLVCVGRLTRIHSLASFETNRTPWMWSRRDYRRIPTWSTGVPWWHVHEPCGKRAMRQPL